MKKARGTEPLAISKSFAIAPPKKLSDLEGTRTSRGGTAEACQLASLILRVFCVLVVTALLE